MSEHRIRRHVTPPPATREADQAAARAVEEKLQAARRRVSRTSDADYGQGLLFDT